MSNREKKSGPSIILGIDPGTRFMGFALIRREKKKVEVIEMGTLVLSKITDPYEKLYRIHEKVSSLIRIHAPEYFAIEAPFYGKNVQSMLKLGRAQGASLAAALQAGLKACEYSPRKVKKAVTGNGNASKEQVSEMVGHIVKNKPLINQKSLDATDALAVAICHHFQLQSGLSSLGDAPKDWKAFMKKYPDKIKK